MLVGVSRAEIVAAARLLLTDEQVYARMACAVNPFGDGSAAKYIVRAVEEFLSVKELAEPRI
jgi:UDP-N-acetylglucosamine 2-epimerase (non-hydrolysing)